MPPRAGGAALYELPEGLGALEAARGTIFFLDWRWLRTRNAYDRYVDQVHPALRERLLAVTSGDWAPVELLQAHYRALDSLGFSREEAVDCGVSVGEALHGSMLRTLVRLAGHLGATPWFAMEQAQKLWSRSWRGAGVRPVRFGDRSARLEIVRNPAARSDFHRASVAGAISVGIGWLCRQHVVKEVDSERRGDGFVLQIDWL
jgi:hypothetical protein